MDIFLLHLVSLLHSGSGLLKGDLGDLGTLAGGLAALETGTGFEAGAFTPVGAGFDKALEATGVAEISDSVYEYSEPVHEAAESFLPATA